MYIPNSDNHKFWKMSTFFSICNLIFYNGRKKQMDDRKKSVEMIVEF